MVNLILRKGTEEARNQLLDFARGGRERASLRLKPAGAVQAASGLAINAAAFVTHDRDLLCVRSLRIIS
jgi:hypothetical protein